MIRLDIARTIYPAQICGSSSQIGIGCAMGASGSHFQDHLALRCIFHPRGFGGYQALMIDCLQEESLDYLCFDDIGSYGNYRFVGEDDSAFFKGEDVSCEAECFQIIQESIGKYALAF